MDTVEKLARKLCAEDGKDPDKIVPVQYSGPDDSAELQDLPQWNKYVHKARIQLGR